MEYRQQRAGGKQDDLINDPPEHLRSIDGRMPRVVQHVSALLRGANFPPLDIEAVRYHLFDPSSRLRFVARQVARQGLSGPAPPPK